MNRPKTDFDDVLVANFDAALGSLADPTAHHEPVDISGFEGRAPAFLRSMWLIRAVEEVVADFAASGLAKTPCHLAIGQEAVPVGISASLRRTDRIFGGHRSHGHYLALGAPLQGLLDEILCRATGVSGGRGGSMHICAPEHGFVGSVPLVAATVPLAVGAALAANMDGKGDIAVAYFGDGAAEEGVVHESLNLARTLMAPVLFVCENNLFSSHLDIRLRQPSDRVARFAEAHRMPAVTVDGNDVCAVARTAGALIEDMRAGGGPAFLEAVTYRFRGHVGPNEDIDVGIRRRMEDVLAWRQRDPILRLERALTGAGLLARQDIEALVTEVRAQVGEAADIAKTRPFPAPETLLDHVFDATGAASR